MTIYREEAKVLPLDPSKRGRAKKLTEHQKKLLQKEKEELDRRIKNEQILINYNLRKPKPIQQPV
jgi:CTP-dependent riboflavin kinase